MTEFEQCLLMTLKDIKSQLNDISGGLQYIGNELGKINETHDSNYGYEINANLEKIKSALNFIGSVQDERL